jgi:hypothetical protein
MLHEADKGDATPAKAHAEGLVRGIGTSTKTALEHPLRDPFATLTTVLPALHGLGKIADVATGAGLTTDAVPKPRLLKVGDTQVPLHGSTHPAVRAAQAIYDKALQHALDTNPEGRIAQHAVKRAAGSIAETERIRQRMAAVPAQLLDQAAARLVRGKMPGPRRVRQAALELTSTNTHPEDAAAYHDAQAAAGVEPRVNRKVAAIYRRVAREGMLTTNEHGDVIVNAETHPALAAADAQLAHVQTLGDQILAEHSIRNEDVLAARRNAPARVRAGATFVDHPIPEAAKAAAQLEASGQMSLAPRGTGEEVGQGFVGGESARPGRGFVSYKVAESKAPRSPIARMRGPVIGETKSPITGHTFTGKGIAQGLVPNDITGQASRHLRQVARFASTASLRDTLARTGSDVRRTSRDVLVKIPGEKAAKISGQIDELLGRKTPTVDTEQTLSAALDNFRNEILPDRVNSFAGDKQHGIGTPAPKGYRWVDEKALGPLTEDTLPRGKPAKLADWLNSAVTSATVYLKPGHVGTRILTNLATNVIQGSWRHAISNRELWDQLTPRDRARALAAAGQHSFQAMPHEGTGRIAAIASKGSAWWAHHADEAFRFNSLAYEARKAGFDTPAKFVQMLDHFETHSEGLNAAEAAKIDWVLKRANRANIAYDRLNPTERRYLARYVWFYPFIKGSAMFAGHTLTEHPYKAAALGAAGQQGRADQAKLLGDLPSYEGGLIPLGGGDSPLVTDLSTFSPVAGAADVLRQPRYGSAAEFLNPAFGALVQGLLRQDQYGQHSNTPVTDALSTLVSPTPEAQVIGAAIHPTHGMFNRTWQSTLERALLGPATPRRINLAKAASAAARERAGR